MWIKFTVVDNGSLLVVVNGVRYLVTTVDHPVLHALLTIVKIMVDGCIVAYQRLSWRDSKLQVYIIAEWR